MRGPASCIGRTTKDLITGGNASGKPWLPFHYPKLREASGVLNPYSVNQCPVNRHFIPEYRENFDQA